MTALVFGGTASGKSEFAETLAAQGNQRTRIYLATMEPFGQEGQNRIARHRLLRREKGFVTLEQYTALKSLHVESGSTVLLEDLGNLCANEMFSPAGCGGPRAYWEIREGISTLCAQAERIVIVSNDIFSGCEQYGGEMADYLSLMDGLHQWIAGFADLVVEVVCGIPIYHKGGQAC